MRSLREGDLQSIIREFRSKQPDGDALFCACYLSTEVIRYYLGSSWANQHLFSHIVGARNDRHFVFGAKESRERFQYSDRLINLGEILYNLWNIPGFETRVRQAANESTIDGLIAEFEVARLLRRAGMVFVFKEPTGRKGEDFDLLVSIGGSDISCEVKSRLEAKLVNGKVIRNVLEKSRTQLPSSGNCCTFIKVSGELAEETGFDKIVSDEIASLFSRSSTIDMVFIVWESWKLTTDGGAIVAPLSRAVIRTGSNEVLFQTFHHLLVGRSRADEWRTFR